MLAAPGAPLVAVRSGEDSDRIGLDPRVDRLVLRPEPSPSDAPSADAH